MDTNARSRLKSGFTLIEILIVMLIIGLTLGFVVVSFGDFGNTRRAKIFAEEFVEYVHLLQYQALLENTVFGVQWGKRGYRTFRLTSQTTWTPTFERQLQPHGLPNNIIAHLQLFGAPVLAGTMKTTLLIHPSGDITPFRLEIGTVTSPQIAKVLGMHNGEVTIQ